MAVIKGIHVSVQADGEPLEERQDTSIVENDVSEMTRYIEAKSGQPFEIHMLTPQEDQFEGNIIAQDIYVDNKLIETVLHQKGSPLDKEVCKGLTLPGGIRFFRFSDVAIEEHNPGSRAEKDPKEHKDVGTIKVVVHHKNLGKASTFYDDPNGWKAINVVNEKTIKGKAVSHSVGLAPPVKLDESSRYYKTTFVDPERVPCAVFRFLYRSAEKLSAIFIPTPTATPEPEVALEDQDPETMTPEQIGQMQRRLKELRPTAEQIGGVKRECTEDTNDDGSRRQKRRTMVTTYMAFRDDDDENFEEVEAPVRTSQPSTQLEIRDQDEDTRVRDEDG